MSPHFFRPFVLPSLLALAAASGLSAAPAHRPARVVESDLAPSEARQPSLDLAARLARPSEPPPISAGLKTPFDFDRADPDETPSPNGQPSNDAPQVKGPREILESVAPLLKPNGTINLGGQPILLFGQRKLKVGDKFTITFEGTDYELELAAIASTSFTLRYKGEETTRPIKSGK
jgi:hypothetical protein